MVFLLWITVLLLMPDAAGAADPLRLSLHESIIRAVEKNLDLQIERYNPAQLEAELHKSRGIYDPALQLTTNYSYDNSSGQNSKLTQLNAAVNQLIPSGATASLGFTNSYLDTDRSSLGSGLTRSWQSGLALSISQPLLKNFGREATELTIASARLSRDLTQEQLYSKLLTVVGKVRDAYFQLYSLHEELEVRKVSLELAQRVLSETQARVKAGVLPSMEVLNAEFGVASREKELIDAERSLRDQEDLLAQLLQYPVGTRIETVDVPDRQPYHPAEAAEITRALAQRPELKKLKGDRALLELQARVTGNRTRPDLVLAAAAATNGLGESYGSDMDRLSNGKNPSWNIGLTLKYPLGNRDAENEYRKVRLKVEQKLLEIRNQEELVANEVRSAVRAIESSYKQLDVADRGRAFAEERLRAWTRKVEVGLATTKDLLDVENDLATAKNNQIKAKVAYAAAMTQLWKATGELLERERIALQSVDPGPLLQGVR